VRYPDRYSDKRGAEIWEEVLGLLANQPGSQRGKNAEKAA
jgi:hypothetical protein